MLPTKFEIRGAVLLVIEKVRPVVFAVVLNSCLFIPGVDPEFYLKLEQGNTLSLVRALNIRDTTRTDRTETFREA